MTLPAKSDKKKVEDHSRNNKSSVQQKNCVDSSISYKRNVINSNSNSVCKTCNKCLMSFNHDKYVVKALKFVKKPPVNKVWKVNPIKQVWQATGKLFTNVGFQWQPTGRKFTLEEQCPLTRLTESKVVHVTQPNSISTSDIVITKRLSNTSHKPLTRYQRKNKQEKATSTSTVAQSIDDYVVHIVLWYLDSGCSKHMTRDRSLLRNFMKKFIGTVKFENDHFGAIMAYGDYVIGDSVISRVYNVKGLGHNLFSVIQFYDLDLEVVFHKHSCYVRHVNGVDLIKGNRGSNLYTISVEDMMKSSPIFLLFKASKHKSWLWHHRLNHLNFGTINDLAQKDLAEVVASACYTQNRSLIHTRHNKTPYDLAHDRKHDLKFLCVFGALCYLANDSEDLGKLRPTTDIGIFFGYALNRKGYRTYNRRT
uniref:Integrase, catalytic region, zinc finger, CCHC-type, peptidase aspartic, catalytic n=1 Tax=Tanacetum cinerariifolium TaxID=118510 RepID=A0A699KD40_TANCI|nr:integrase, catalytic region, zinc finger, CCHC-type, peptidase aspartic, catalytic [Tanacetum cinerariifolium]